MTYKNEVQVVGCITYLADMYKIYMYTVGQIGSSVISTGNRLNYKTFTFSMYKVCMIDWC